MQVYDHECGLLSLRVKVLISGKALYGDTRTAAKGKLIPSHPWELELCFYNVSIILTCFYNSGPNLLKGGPNV